MFKFSGSERRSEVFSNSQKEKESKVTSAEIFRGIKLPINLTRRGEELVPMLCSPRNSHKWQNSVGIVSELLLGLNKKILSKIDLNEEVTKLVEENQTRQTTHESRSFGNTQNDVCHQLWAFRNTKWKISEDASVASTDGSFLGSLKLKRSTKPRVSLRGRPASEKNHMIKDYKCSISYLPGNSERRKKRVIHCGYGNWTKTFTKTWNFIDHARMHEGVRPFVCTKCHKKFTQRWNLKKHLERHNQ